MKSPEIEYDKVLKFYKENLKKQSIHIIAIEGHVYTGKSTLARWLSWKINGFWIDLDLIPKASKNLNNNDFLIFKTLIENSYNLNSPIIISGIKSSELILETAHLADLIIIMQRKTMKKPKLVVDQYFTDSVIFENIDGNLIYQQCNLPQYENTPKITVNFTEI